MTPDELKTLRKSLGSTQKDLSDALGVSIVTIQRYEQGLNPIPKVVEMALGQLNPAKKRYLLIPAGGPVRRVLFEELQLLNWEHLGDVPEFALKVYREIPPAAPWQPAPEDLPPPGKEQALPIAVKLAQMEEPAPFPALDPWAFDPAIKKPDQKKNQK